MPPLRRPTGPQPNLGAMAMGGPAVGGMPPPPVAARLPGRPPMPMGGGQGRPTGMSPAGGAELPLPLGQPQPNAGGPTSPLNVGASGMLQPNQQPPSPTAPGAAAPPPPNAPLTPWGAETQPHGQTQEDPELGVDGQPMAGVAGAMGANPGAGSPQVILKLLQLMGHL